MFVVRGQCQILPLATWELYELIIIHLKKIATCIWATHV